MRAAVSIIVCFCISISGSREASTVSRSLVSSGRVTAPWRIRSLKAGMIESNERAMPEFSITSRASAKWFAE